MRFVLLLLLGCDRARDYVVLTYTVHDADAVLKRYPCDAVSMLRLMTALDDAGKSSEAMDRFASRPATCPRSGGTLKKEAVDRLEKKALDVAVRAARWADAEAIIGRMIDASPQDPANYIVRSGLREKLGNASGAASDRRQAFLVAPEALALDYARSLGKTPGDCAAWEAWGFVREFHPDQPAEVDLHGIDPTKTCAGVTGKAGRAKEGTAGGGPALVGTIGGKEALFSWDARPKTIVSPAVAASVGMTPAPELLRQIGPDLSSGHPAAIPPLAFGGLTVTGLEGLVGEPYPYVADVVLGIDFTLRVETRSDGFGWWDMRPRN